MEQRALTPPHRPFITYLSGPMTGLPDSNYPAFREWTRKLEAFGHHVLSPANNYNGKRGLPRDRYLSLDIALVLESDGLALMPGWTGSEGSKLEFLVARETGKEIILLDGAEDVPEVLEMKARLEDVGSPAEGVK